MGAEEIVDFTPQPDPFERFTKTLGIAAGSAVGKLLTSNHISLN